MSLRFGTLLTKLHTSNPSGSLATRKSSACVDMGSKEVNTRAPKRPVITKDFLKLDLVSLNYVVLLIVFLEVEVSKNRMALVITLICPNPTSIQCSFDAFAVTKFSKLVPQATRQVPTSESGFRIDDSNDTDVFTSNSKILKTFSISYRVEKNDFKRSYLKLPVFWLGS